MTPVANLLGAINGIPATHKPIAQIAAIKLAANAGYWQRDLPDDPAMCAKLIGFDPRTMRKHWEEVKLILETYLSEED